MQTEEKLELSESIIVTVSECPHCPSCAELAKLYMQNVKAFAKEDLNNYPPDAL